MITCEIKNNPVSYVEKVNNMMKLNNKMFKHPFLRVSILKKE